MTKDTAMCYAGIGSRQTPDRMLGIMTVLGMILGSSGHTLHTGACKGADQAFANGASISGKVKLFLPWSNYEKEWVNNLGGDKHIYTIENTDVDAFASVKQYHPAIHKLSPPVVKLHARNYLILKNADFVVCWTPEGKTTGGTGQGIRIAQDMGIPVFNLAFTDSINKIMNFIV